MHAVLLIVLVVMSTSVLWAVVTALAGRLLGATVLKVVLFLGPTVRLARWGGVEIRAGLIPCGSAVVFLDADSVQQAYAEARAAGEIAEETGSTLGWIDRFVAGRRLFDDLPLPTRLTILLIGWVAVFLFAQVILGFQVASAELLESFGQLFRFFADPAYSKAALAGLAETLAAGLWDQAAATVSLRILAINLLPLPLFAGGQILAAIAASIRRRRTAWPSLLVTLNVAAVLLALAILVERLWTAFF